MSTPLLNLAIRTAINAGNAIMEVYKKDFTIEQKEDKSPVTQADKLAHKIIVQELGNQYPILSEEGRNIPFQERSKWNTLWIVDPIDGTKEFINKNDEFTINIALVTNNKLVLGVVYAPALNKIYYASEQGTFKADVFNGEVLNPIQIKTVKPEKKLIIVASRSHLNEQTQEYIDNISKQYEEIEMISAGSSLKMCLVAEGKAHIYPRLASTSQWDTAAGQAVVEFAGGRVIDQKTNTDVIYNQENILNNEFVVVWQ